MTLQRLKARLNRLLAAHPAQTPDARASAEAILAELDAEIKRRRADPEAEAHRELTPEELAEMSRSDDQILRTLAGMIRAQQPSQALS